MYYITIALHGEFKTDLAFWMVAAAMTTFGIATALLARSKALLLMALSVPAAQLILLLLAFASLIILMFAKAAVNLIAQFFTGEMVWPEPMSF